MIEIKNLHKSYKRGKEIIPNLNLKFDKTGLTMIVGKSGCGKTTLLNIIGSMDMDFEGQVIVDGQDLKDKSYKELVDYRNFTSAFVFQKNSLFEFLTVEENLKLCMNIQNNTADISDALEKVGLKGFEHKMVKSLSGGEKQRVAIARALIKNCKIIFADEPTSALDTKNAHQIFQLFKDISKDKLVVLVTHDMKKAVLYADRIIKFVDGVPVEDTRYNEVSNEAKVLPDRKTKKFALMPIFRNHLKKGMTINIFIILLLIVALSVTNLAIAGKKVKDEYDYYGTEEQIPFNVDRAMTTQIKNHIDLFNVVKSEGVDNAYSYLENGQPGNTRLNDVDSKILDQELKEYNVYKGTNDSLHPKLVIDTVSQQQTKTQEVNGIKRYWEKIKETNYIYYLYDANNNYDIIEGGRLPDTDNENEILISDVVAWQYLCNKNRKVPESNDPSIYEELYDDNFVIYDTNGKYQVGEEYYYSGNYNEYKVVGVINTGLLDFYTYSVDQLRFLFNKEFKNQDDDRYAVFMNSVKSQPFGYVVLQKPLLNAIDNPFYYNNFEMENITMYNDDVTYSLENKKVNAFTGDYDYKTNIAEMYDRYKNNFNGTHKPYELAGRIDNLSIDGLNRIIALSTSNEDLEDNEIIISIELAEKLFPKLRFNSDAQIRNSFVDIANKEIKISYNAGQNTINRIVKIVGISRDYGIDGMFYASNDLYSEMYKARYGQAESITINLKGKDLKQRKALMEKLFKLGYSLAPVDIMPGSYLEFVDGKGETYAEVDGEGLKALYPNSEIKEIDGQDYFVNEGMVFGLADVVRNSSGDVTIINTVYMTSTMVKKIALDASYITKNIGNLSLYYLFSDYYTFDSTITGNHMMEIMASMYAFLLGMATLIAIGFIYLKENKEKDTMTKLSMLGVRPAHIYLIHLITYFMITLVIIAGTLLTTYLFVGIINNLFTYSFESGAVIYRIRLMFETSAVTTTILFSIGFFILSMISSIFVTYKSRK